MTKLSPFVPLLAPPVWTWTSGLFLTPLATALGSAHPDLVSSAWQCVVFVGSLTFAGWAIGKTAQGNASEMEYTEPEPTPLQKELTQIRDRTQRRYGFVVNPPRKLRLALALANGKGGHTRVFRFPDGIDRSSILALAQVIASGKRPTNRNLCPPFRMGDGEDLSLMRDYLMSREVNKFAVMAEYLDGRDAWDFTSLGKRVLLQLALRLVEPTSPPYPVLRDALKVQISGSKANL